MVIGYVCAGGREMKVAIVCMPGLTSFITHIEKHLREKHEVKTWYGGEDGGEDAQED